MCATSACLSYAILVLIVIHKYHSWVGLLVASLLWKLVRVPFSTMKTGPRGVGFMSVSVLEPLGPASEVHGVFSNRDLP